MKPSDRIEQLAREIAVERLGDAPLGELSNYSKLDSTRVEAVTRYLDEVHGCTKTWNEFLSVAETCGEPVRVRDVYPLPAKWAPTIPAGVEVSAITDGVSVRVGVDKEGVLYGWNFKQDKACGVPREAALYFLGELHSQLSEKQQRINELLDTIQRRDERIAELKSRKLGVFEAVKKLQLVLEADPDFYRTWKSNIAMAIYDELDPHIKMETCNKAAERFLRVLCMREKEDG